MAARQFDYDGQTQLGQVIRGEIAADSLEDARAQLERMGVVVTGLAVADRPPPRPRTMGRDDFLLFNQQLAYLAEAGLPMEQGLRLIAGDVRSGRLASAANDVADELERGTPIEVAFGKHESRFPRLYARVVAAGVKARNLPSLLLNVGHHIELVSRLRQTLWRTLAYPLMVIVMMLLVMLLISTRILPMLREVFRDFRTQLPWITEVMLWVGEHVYIVLLVVVVTVGLLLFLYLLSKTMRGTAAITEGLLLAIPLIGNVLRRSLLARWCDALRLGVESGMDLPAALQMAGDAVGSPQLQREGEELGHWIASGRPLSQLPDKRTLIPATVPAAIDLGARSNDLPQTLATLTRLYEMQAEHALKVVPIVLLPILLLVFAFMMGFAIMGTFLPLWKLMQSVSGGEGF